MRKETTSILEKYIGELLTTNNINIDHAALSLEITFGPSIHTHIKNFIAFAEREGLEESDIVMTLAHDVGGGLRNDTLMLPRVSSF